MHRSLIIWLDYKIYRRIATSALFKVIARGVLLIYTSKLSIYQFQWRSLHHRQRRLVKT
jgi:hypothetical protein